MDIITTALSTTVASIAIVVTSIFGVNTANATSTPVQDSTTVAVVEQTVTIKPITVCGSGGLVPANAPKCPTGK